jgi:adenylate kinase family enzyme
MERVLVMGPPGSGKSTLALQLGRQLGIQVVHLDALHFLPGWIEVKPEVEEGRLREIVAGEQWIIDGNYSRMLDIRLPRADTVILLDFPLSVCYWRVLKRWLIHRGRPRPDMAPECPEKIDLAFLQWIAGWPTRSRPRVLARLEEVRGEKAVWILRRPAEVSHLLHEVGIGLR